MSAPQTRRVQHGNGHRYLLDGMPADGVTSILSNGVPKPALINWAARVTAGYAVDRWDELAQLAVSERLRLLERARFDEKKSAAVRGTDVHTIAAQLATGEEVDVPEHLAGYVDAYLRFAEDWDLVDELVEVPILNRRYRYMGTPDLVGLLRGERWLLDWKTSASGIWPETALQLAAYAHAEAYLDAEGTEHPLPPIARTGAVWLRADGYDLVPCDAGPATFRTFLYVQQVAAFTTSDRGVYVRDALRPEVTV